MAWSQRNINRRILSLDETLLCYITFGVINESDPGKLLSCCVVVCFGDLLAIDIVRHLFDILVCHFP